VYLVLCQTLKSICLFQNDLFMTLCKVGDELLARQIVWIKKLPFFDKLSIKGN